MEKSREMVAKILTDAAENINELTGKVSDGADDLTGLAFSNVISSIEGKLSAAAKLWCGDRNFSRNIEDLQVVEKKSCVAR